MRRATESRRKGSVEAVMTTSLFDSEIVRSIGIGLLVLALWFGGGYISAGISGWSDLADAYRARGEFGGRTTRFRTAWFTWWLVARWNLTLGADTEGLYLAMMLPMWPWTPPLFIPWKDISIHSRTIWFFDYWEYRFRGAPNVSISLNPSLGQKLAEWAGRNHIVA